MENKIIKKPKHFSLKHIFECGQVFRYKRINDFEYEVYSKDKKAILKEEVDTVEIISDDILYFENYLDLNRDYEKIIKTIIDKPLIKENIKKADGIRILNQDPFEVIISFIISANNNIPRIKKIIEKICEKYGTKMDGYYSFPNQKQLAKAKEEELTEIGCGYRANYIYETAKKLENLDFDKEYKNLDFEILKKEITSLKGVGPKVFDCIALFGFHSENVFPVDTWSRKIYKDIFPNKNADANINILSKDLVNIYSPFSSYAQQYLFYAKRVDNNLDMTK